MTDRFAAIDYDALIDWQTRLAREAPFLDRALAGIPSRRLLDLGCGPGHHARLLASRGFEVVGIDASPSMLEKAREGDPRASVRFVPGDLVELDGLVDGTFGAAVCLGNTLPSVRTAAGLARLLDALRARLLPGGVFVLQLLNYEKIFSTRQRHLPLTMRPADGGGSLVFVRLMDLRPGGDVVFAPTVLGFQPAADPAVTLRASERVEVHGWTRAELEDSLEAAGFRSREIYGTVGYDPYVATESPDLVLLAR